MGDGGGGEALLGDTGNDEDDADDKSGDEATASLVEMSDGKHDGGTESSGECDAMGGTQEGGENEAAVKELLAEGYGDD